MPILTDVLHAIGNTPLIRLKAASEATGCEILGKAEFLNPGQSVKDRAALGIIEDAESRGVLQPGGAIVEGTAGNTGIGLAMVAAARGYRATIVMPRTQSIEKKNAVTILGAELIEVDAVPFSNPDHYVRYSERLARERGAFWANQFDNTANRLAHERTTGPEIWAQTQGKVDGFICAVGSGGTLAGVSAALKARNSAIKIGLADPHGAALYSHYAHGVLKAEGSSIIEGIGQSRITANLDGASVDMAFQISDAEALAVLYDLIRLEGLCLGGSAGINLAGAMAMARALGPGHVIVTILCDYGHRYQSKLYNPAFLREKGLPLAPWMKEPG